MSDKKGCGCGTALCILIVVGIVGSFPKAIQIILSIALVLFVILYFVGKNEKKNDKAKAPREKQAKPISNGIIQSTAFHVAGVYYHKSGVTAIRRVNPDWRKKPEELWKKYGNHTPIPHFFYKDYPVELDPEPNNQYDPNAIRVLIDDSLVGYVPADRAVEIANILSQTSVVNIQAEFNQRDFKYFVDENTLEDGDPGAFPGIKINITYQ